MRKIEALKEALKRPLKLPKLNDATKLWISGIMLWILCIILTIILAYVTRSAWSIILFVIGGFIFFWFTRASIILDEEEWEKKWGKRR